MDRGKLVVLEGIEGVGKTTQLRLMTEWASARGMSVVALREPGGTPLGDEIRRLLLDPRSDIGATAEALLFMASRAQLVEQVVRPALVRGDLVLLDRFFLSTYAYQCAGRGLSEPAVRSANAFATGDLAPDLTLLLSLPVAEGLSRAAQRSEQDRMERADDAFHQRVAAAFASFASAAWQSVHPECGRIVTIDASGTKDVVFHRILSALHDWWPASFPYQARSLSS